MTLYRAPPNFTRLKKKKSFTLPAAQISVFILFTTVGAGNCLLQLLLSSTFIGSGPIWWTYVPLCLATEPRCICLLMYKCSHVTQFRIPEGLIHFHCQLGGRETSFLRACWGLCSSDLYLSSGVAFPLACPSNWTKKQLPTYE